MSNYARTTKNPLTGKFELAEWLDDHFGRHHYGVKFGSTIFRAEDYEWEFDDEADESRQKSIDEMESIHAGLQELQKVQTYSVSIICSNCNKIQILIIPKGERVGDNIRKCNNCGCAVMINSGGYKL